MSVTRRNSQQVFEDIIGGSIKKLRDFLSSYNKDELYRLNQSLKNQKTTKELNANRYFFLFYMMCNTKSQPMILECLQCMHSLLQYNFLSISQDIILEISLLQLLSDLRMAFPHQVGAILVAIKSVNPSTLIMLFDVFPYTNKDLRYKVKTTILSIVARTFSFKRKPLTTFVHKVCQAFGPAEPIVPDYELVTEQEQSRLLSYYISKMLVDMTSNIERYLSTVKPQVGKFGLCFLCRNPAEYYCKDTMVPVCSVDCKKTHLQYLDRVSRFSTVPVAKTQAEIADYLLRLLYSYDIDQSVRLVASNCIIEIIKCSSYRMSLPQPLLRYPQRSLEEKKQLLLIEYLCHPSEYYLLTLMQSEYDYNLKALAYYFFRILLTDNLLIQVYSDYDRRDQCVIGPLILHFKNEQPLLESMLRSIITTTHSIDEHTMNDIQKDKLILKLLNTNLEEGVKELKEGTSRFLAKHSWQIHRYQLNKYFAQKNSEHMRVLKEYLLQFDLQHLEVDEAVKFLFYLFEVRESQQIYRILEVLSEVYSHHKFQSVDELFQFFYFVLMLQTELHNPSVYKKMTFYEMVNRVATFNQPLSVDRPFLYGVYWRVKTRPFTKNDRPILHRVHMRYSNGTLVAPISIIYEYWELVLQQLSSYGSIPCIDITYRICVSCLPADAIQHFAYLLLKDLQKINMLDRDRKLTEHEAYLIGCSFTMLHHNPNLIATHWTEILYLLTQYQHLGQALSQYSTPTLQHNHHVLHTHLSQIHRIVAGSQLLTDDNIVGLSKAIAETPEPFYLYHIPYFLRQNLIRLDTIWPYASQYILKHDRADTTGVCSRIMELLPEDHPYQLYILKWHTDTAESTTITQFILSVKNIRPIWSGVLQSTHLLSPNCRCHLAQHLAAPLSIYFIKSVLQSNPDDKFIRENQAVIYKHSAEFYQILGSIKKEQLRLFIMPCFLPYIVKHISLFPQLYPELSHLLKNSTNLGDDSPAILQFIDIHIKNIDSDGIQLLIQLLKVSSQALDVVYKVMGSLQTTFSTSYRPNYNTVVKKTVLELILLRSLQDILGDLKDYILLKLVELVDNAIQSSREFNRNIGLRHQLWKDGLMKDLKQLPGLLKKYQTAVLIKEQMLRVLAYRTNNWDMYVAYIGSLLRDQTSRYKEYKNTKEAKDSKDPLLPYYLNYIDKELNELLKLMQTIESSLEYARWDTVSANNRLYFICWVSESYRVGLFWHPRKDTLYTIQETIMSRASIKAIDSLKTK